MQCPQKDMNKQINNCKCEISETKYTFVNKFVCFGSFT